VNYIKNYAATGLIPALFPGVNVELKAVERIGNVRGIRPVLAWLFRNNEPKAVRSQLNRLKYANDVSVGVEFLLKLFQFDVEQVALLLRHRDLYKQRETPELQQIARTELERDVLDFAKITGKERELRHFLSYQSPVKSQDYMHLQGKAIRDAMTRDEAESYKRTIAGQA
jgi:hypothetical protein